MSFTEKVYEFIRTIPKGRVMTYGDVAAAVGSPKAARAVGMAMRNNPDAPKTPCHRVVASDGTMHGYSGEGGINGKMKMLKEEGVWFKGMKVDLEKSEWKV